MNEIDSLLSQFQNTSEQSTPLMWGETTSEKPTPESEDGERLEQSLRDVFSNKKLLNKALATFLGVFTANAGVSLLTSLGISAIASGTLSSIVLGLFFANTLTKIQYDGRIHIGKDFMVATAQTASVGVALWVAFDEYRMVSNASKTGKTRFYSEVRQYEVKPSPQTDTPWLMIGLAALGVLLLAAMTRGRSQ
jgi:phosphoribosyl-AMP cyclohydrolase